MTGPVLEALWSHWRSHRLQLVTLIIGIALATGLWSAVQAINAEARASYARANAQLALGQYDQLTDPSGPIPISRYADLRRSGWQVSAVLDGSIRVKERSVRVMGVDMISHPALPAIIQMEQGDAPPDPADILTSPGRLLMAPTLAEFFRNLPDYPPVISSDALPPELILTDIGVAEHLLNRKNQISRLIILPEQPQGLPDLKDVAPELLRTTTSGQLDTAQLTDSFHLNLSAFGLLSFAVGLFIVHGTVGLAFAQRRSMIRTLRALGVPMRRLVWIIMSELVLLALLGGALGLVLGFFLAGALLPGVAATLQGLYGAPAVAQLTFRPDWAMTGMMMAVAGTLVASGQALWKLARLPLLAGSGVQAWGKSTVARRMAGWAGLGLITVGIVAHVGIGGLVSGFVMLAGLLTGSALILPTLMSRAITGLRRFAKKPITEWVLADMQAQLPGLSLALMALLLALAANIGVSTMVSSFRLTFTGWLDQRLTADLYVTASDDVQAGEITTWLSPKVDAILPIRNVELDHETGPLFVYGVVDDRAYRQNWPLIARTDHSWDVLNAGKAVLINEQLARREGLWPGDKLALIPDVELEIAGVYSDYGNPTGQAIVAMSVFDTIAPDAPARRMGLRIPKEKVDDVALTLHERFDLPQSAIIRQDRLKAQSMAIFEKTFVVTSALNILTLAIAAFAILTSLLTLWTQRIPQIAPVWAIGATRAKLARLEVLQSLALAALTAFLALPLGLALAWVLLTIINVEAFGWRLPMYLFPMDWVRLLVLTLLAASLAAAISAWRIRRLPPADLLRVFANER